MNVKNLINILPFEYISKIADNKPELLDWNKISREFRLTENFIEKYKSYVNWKEISINQRLSELFIEKYQNVVD